MNKKWNKFFFETRNEEQERVIVIVHKERGTEKISFEMELPQH